MIFIVFLTESVEELCGAYIFVSLLSALTIFIKTWQFSDESQI